MTNNILWSPKHSSNFLNNFIKNLNKKKFFNKKDYNSLHKWSVKNKKKFWKEIWNFCSIIGSLNEPIIENEKNFINSIFFKNCKLNFTKNLLQNNNNRDALIFYSEKGLMRKITWQELNILVCKLSFFLKENKIKRGDRIAGILPNMPETIVSFLASAKIGAIWSSCSTDFGPQAVIDRFKQIKPKILFITDYYYYNNKKINTLNKIPEIIKELPSIKKIILIPYEKNTKYKNYKFKFIYWKEVLENSSIDQNYQEFDFNIPLYILYSSGTTGQPKCIVHGAGGSLLQHKKEHMLHCNIRSRDKVFYYTTCGWMMWNWLVSCLASNATLILYDGSPFIPNYDHLFKIAEIEKINFFGIGAKYIDSLRQKKIKIISKYKLKELKTIASTGSPLVHESFKYVYNNIKKDVHLASISGGTEICSCFVLGNPMLPVYEGEIQSKGLGMDVTIYNEKGKEIIDEKGELVCKSPFPSKPLFFWNDKKNEKYSNAYFNKFKNIWHHGDYAKITKNEGCIIYGRSDATLNSGGIRIGTAELYRVVENIKGIEECVAVEKNLKNDTKVILFIILKKKYKFNNLLELSIKNKIRHALSPKHIPSKIISVNDIPRTKSGKIVELTIKKIVNNEKIINSTSLANPECIREFKVKIKKTVFN